MEAKSVFQRIFLIFVNEDAGYEGEQKPSGHIKLEVREGRGKLYAAVQNLRPGNGRFVYKLYLLRANRDEVVPICSGQLVPEPNKAELEWSFDPCNVGASGYGIEEFGSAVVLAEYANRPDDAIVCPLAAYKNKKAEWRSGLRVAMLKRKAEANVQYSQYANHAIEPHTNTYPSIDFKTEPPVAEVIYDNASDSIKPLPTDDLFPGIPEVEKPDEASDEVVDRGDYSFSETQWQQDQLPPDQLPLEQLSSEPQLPYEQQQMPQIQTPDMFPQPPKEQLRAQNQDNLGQIDTGCVYLNGNMCSAFVNNDAGGANPCEACRMHQEQEQRAAPLTGDVSRLKEELDRYFEQSDPFHSKRSDYLWWRVNNPVNLNNLLYQCNIRSPLLFNPVVMMAHYKYRHLIIGIFQHKAKQKQYVVCGVPGMHMVDTKPFGGMSRWVQAEGNRPRYGAFGYWLVYINPNDGKILNMSQE